MVEDLKNIDQIFWDALQIEGATEREAFLARSCGDDKQLRQMIEKLIKAQPRAERFLEEPFRLGDTADTPAVTEQAGTVIGPYKLLQQIGEGGMGVVFMAEQTEPIQRTVALKIIKPGMDTRQVIARFEAERQALAMMDHPNIAKVLDAGTTESGRPYFVMELVKGIPITKYCDEKHLSLRERLDLFIQVCQAVQHAHQKGIIHRDIKPTNVIIAEYDNHAVPKVIDFGVAKATAQKLTERTMFTEFGQVIGTVEYMSPEQAKFNHLDIDTRSDIYSLGVLLYELLTGTTPFERKRLQEAAFDEMLRIIREEEPPKPSTKLSSADTLPSVAANRHTEPVRLSKDVRGELDWIAMKCLEKDRNRRFETANALTGDIERYLRDEPVQASPPSATYRFRKLARRYKGTLATVATLAAVLVAASVFSTWQAVRATRAFEAESAARKDADDAKLQSKAEAQKAKTEAAIAQAVNDFLNQDLLEQAMPEYVPFDRYEEPAADLKLLTVLDRAAEKLEGRFAGQPLVEAALRHTIGRTYGNLGNENLAVLQMQRAVELREAHLGKEHPDTLTSMMHLAWVKFDPDYMTQVVETRLRVFGRDDRDTLESMRYLAMATRIKSEQTGDKRYAARAIELFREAIEAQRSALGEDDIQTAWTMHCLAHTLVMNAGKDGIPPADHREIESLYRHALAVYRKHEGDAAWGTFNIIARLAEFLNLRRRYEEAEALLQDALTRLQSLPGAPPDVAAAFARELDAVYQKWGKPERAAKVELKRLTANESTLSRNLGLPRDLTDDADALASSGRRQRLGDVLLKQGKLAEAAIEYTEAIRLRPNEHGPYYGLGSANAFGGQWTKATAAFERATELSPADLWSVYRWATLCCYTNDHDGYRRACRAMLDHFGQTKSLLIADCTAKACSLAPESASVAEQVVKLADFIVTGTEQEPARKWYEITKGLVDYRAGRFGPAAEIILRSAPSNEGLHRDALAFSILAMAQHRLGKTEEARSALADAQRILLTKMPKTEKGQTFGDDWHDWLHSQILYREAEELLKETATETTQ
jgi:non-specific serine/threonine protein kinase/serine/threonine-protein kinase